MAKQSYFVLVYAEDLQKQRLSIDDLCADIQKYGAETAYILHDKDDAKPHYHLVCAWGRSPMPWENEFTPKHKLKRLGFLCWMVQHNCLAIQENPYTHKVVTKFSRSVAAVRDIDAVIRYMTHENA